ncbi:unnamed protein product [Arctia plantaginis]|uniref:Uncharacterized protein n=1 Tax=Arctia plantaginis TaxID=874455 RepID=A0A8S0YPF3_ARCPL|nr:unnamed protein product [Arctia plantaginis]
MFFVIAVCGVFVVAANDSETFGYENTNDGSGNYKFRFMTLNGITREETGRLVNVGENDDYIAVNGSYSYIDPDGIQIVVNYIADKNGYRILPEIPRFELPPNVVASLLGK